VVELAVVEWQRLGLAFDQLDSAPERRIAAHLRARPLEHGRTLVDPDHSAPIAPHQRLSHQPGAGRHVQDALVRARTDGGDHRTPPAGILEEAERGPHLVVAARQLFEQLQRVLLAGRAWWRVFGARLQRLLHLAERLAIALEPAHQRRQYAAKGGAHRKPRTPAGERFDHNAPVAAQETRPVAPQTLTAPRELPGRVGDHDPRPEP
jgi:hypothetical protein